MKVDFSGCMLHCDVDCPHPRHLIFFCVEILTLEVFGWNRCCIAGMLHHGADVAGPSSTNGRVVYEILWLPVYWLFIALLCPSLSLLQDLMDITNELICFIL